MSFCSFLSAIWSMDEAAGNPRLDQLSTFNLLEVAGPIAAAHGHVGTIDTFAPLANEYAAGIAYGGTQFLETADGPGLKASTGLCVTGWFRLDRDGASDPTGEQLIVEKEGEWGLAYRHDTGLYFWVMIEGSRVRVTASGVLLAGTDDWYWVCGWYDPNASGGPTVNLQKGNTSTRGAVQSRGARGILDVSTGALRFGGGSFVP